VLVIGRSQRVIDDAVAGLRELGYTAKSTNDLSNITGRFDFTEIDVIVLGTQVSPDRKSELKAEIGAINPRVIFVDGLGGIPGVIINQVQGVFAADQEAPDRAPTYTADSRSIRLTLADPAHVKVTVFWRTSIVPPDPKSDSLVLVDDRLGAGDHAIPVPARVFIEPTAPEEVVVRPSEAVFATVQVDAAIYTFSISMD
jgi:hypothetical protein